MSAGDVHGAQGAAGAQRTSAGERTSGAAVTEEELRAAYEEELRRMTSTDLMVQAAVSLINLAGARLGPPPLSAGEGGATEGSQAGAGLRDLEQVRDAIDGVRALLGVLERRLSKELGPLRDALSQLQLAYAREAQADAGTRESSTGARQEPEGDPPQARDPQGSAGDPEAPPGPGPAESSGRLWVPGR